MRLDMVAMLKRPKGIAPQVSLGIVPAQAVAYNSQTKPDETVLTKQIDELPGK